MKKNKYDFLIFGAGGMQGQIVIRDLVSKKYKVFISDIYQKYIDKILETIPDLPYKLLDLQDTAKIISLILLPNCVPPGS